MYKIKSVYLAISLLLQSNDCQSAGYPRCGVDFDGRDDTDLSQAAGEKTNTVLHPWAVAILKPDVDDETKYDVHCSGALITPSYVISAGHCFSGRNPANSKLPIDKLTLAFGLDDKNQIHKGLPIQFRKIKATYPYKTYSYPSAYNDVAVVELSKPVKLGGQTWPICLPEAPTQDQDHMSRDFAVLVGYGPEKDDSSDLNQIRQQIESTHSCNGLYEPENAQISKRESIRARVSQDLPDMFTDKSVICATDAFSDAKGTCPGDSGAPLIVNIRDKNTFQKKKTLVAVLHGGLESCDNSVFPAIYTRVTTPEIWKWIMEEFVNKVKTEPVCKSKEFQCLNGGCIPKAYLCDMEKDCQDGSDEMDCQSAGATTTTTTTTTASSTTTSVSISSGCPDEENFRTINGGCYFFTDKWMNYNDAKSFCEDKNVNGRPGHLAEPRTSAINKLIFDEAKILLGSSYPNYWIGLNDIDEENNWVYSSSGLPATTTFFDSGEPNANGDCVITCHGTGEWCDTSCDGTRNVVCEF